MASEINKLIKAARKECRKLAEDLADAPPDTHPLATALDVPPETEALRQALTNWAQRMADLLDAERAGPAAYMAAEHRNIRTRLAEVTDQLRPAHVIYVAVGLPVDQPPQLAAKLLARTATATARCLAGHTRLRPATRLNEDERAVCAAARLSEDEYLDATRRARFRFGLTGRVMHAASRVLLSETSRHNPYGPAISTGETGAQRTTMAIAVHLAKAIDLEHAARINPVPGLTAGAEPRDEPRYIEAARLLRAKADQMQRDMPRRYVAAKGSTNIADILLSKAGQAAIPPAGYVDKAVVGGEVRVMRGRRNRRPQRDFAARGGYSALPAWWMNEYAIDYSGADDGDDDYE
ncbi:hypothetical protein [Streptomyces sp. CS014]|uniref:hypothetical protein n=1 Tax=Streptomyces sp. CS014 TaxID=2162707 RepID=UPI000D519D87|nr:hypothetical protein [Streptomyces sp. CS014]PVD04461.1 hypothetical protein DBP12_03280 [Streptomyces sp. CS014]